MPAPTGWSTSERSGSSDARFAMKIIGRQASAGMPTAAQSGLFTSGGCTPRGAPAAGATQGATSQRSMRVSLIAHSWSNWARADCATMPFTIEAESRSGVGSRR